jgi:hypothetical protein
MDIYLEIEQLILDGIDLPHHQRPFLQATVETELAHLLAGGGLAPGLQTGRTIPQLSAEAIELTKNPDPTALGQQIARAVYGGIGGEATDGR